jgi:hypothetical protein
MRKKALLGEKKALGLSRTAQTKRRQAVTKPSIKVALPWLCWIGLIAAALLSLLLKPERDVAVYRTGSHLWLQGQPLYTEDGDQFLYAPQAAILYAPFAVLPSSLGGCLWRLVNITVFALGAWRLLITCAARARPHLFLVVSLFSISLSVGSALNGQFNLVMGGLMMLAAAATANGRWWSAALCLHLALALKPLALVPMLIMAALYPPILLRLAALIPLVLFGPFLTQAPSYVTAQYASFLHSLSASSAKGDEKLFTHIFSTMRLMGLDLPSSLRHAARVAAAGITFLLCLMVRLRRPAGETSFFLFSLATGYLLVFNPRAEGMTYCLLGPALGIWSVLHLSTWQAPHRWLVLSAAPTMAFLVIANYELGKHVLPESPARLFTPIVGCAFFFAICIEALTRCRMREEIAQHLPAPHLPSRKVGTWGPPSASRS